MSQYNCVKSVVPIDKHLKPIKTSAFIAQKKEGFLCPLLCVENFLCTTQSIFNALKIYNIFK